MQVRKLEVMVLVWLHLVCGSEAKFSERTPRRLMVVN